MDGTRQASFALFSRDSLAAAMRLLAFALTYYLGVRIGFAFTPADSAVSLFWPANAILLTALLIAPARIWAWLLLAALPAHLISQLAAGVPLTMASAWYVSNVSEALIGAAIIRALLHGAPRFHRLADAAVYLLVSVLAAPLLTSFLDAGLVALVGWRYEGDYWAVFSTRLLSNALVALIVPPLVIASWQTRRSLLQRVRLARLVEAAVLIGMLCIVCFVVFHRSSSASLAAMSVYAPLPLLLWAAVRTGFGGVSASVAIVAVMAMTGVLRNTGPFVLDDPEMSVLSLHVFLILMASSFMLLAAALAELRHARASAVRRQERLDLALSAARMGAWEWDLDSDRISWRWGTQSGEVIAGEAGSTDELLAKVHPQDRNLVASAMRATRASGKADEVECRFVCAGGVRWIRGLGKVHADRADAARAVIGICIDTTHRKSLEAEQRTQREKLAHLARAAALGEMTGALAHELSQPLAAIRLNTYAARQELGRPQPRMQELKAIFDDITADDERAGEVITRLRALFPRDSLTKEPVCVAECIQSILALERSDLLMRNVTVDLSIDTALPPVIAAQDQLQQALLNLILNACEAMALTQGERRLQIAARSHEGEVRVAVRDNGSGVADFQRIFEPFFSTKRHGVGLGLAIARTIVVEHGGRLWAVNNAEGGATFFIALPTATVPA